MLSMRSLVLSSVLPYDKYTRVELLDELRQELWKLIDAWPDEAAGQERGPHAHFPALQLDAWWAAWQEAIEAASEGKPVGDGQRPAVPAA
jgi:hypothetical protein